MVADPPVHPAAEQDEDYASSEDEDFNPTAADGADEEVSSSSDEEPTEAALAKLRKAPKKRKQDALDDLDSGDEATIRESKRSRKRKDAEANEDSGGEGGLIKTRAQRRVEKQERQEYRAVDTGAVTVDVDDLWAKLSNAPVGRPRIQVLEEHTAQDSEKTAPTPLNDAASTIDTPTKDKPRDKEDNMITIKRTYDFAGQKVTEEKRVHKTSAEAKLYLASHDVAAHAQPSAQIATEPRTAFRRPLKRASMFEPNPTGEVKGLPADRQRLRTPSRADVVAQQRRLDDEAAERQARAKKINTVQKSAMDWAAHVDEQGFQQELDEYGRSKQGYMGKMDFLSNVAGKRDEDARVARLGG